jgi:hypothetical protein
VRLTRTRPARVALVTLLAGVPVLAGCDDPGGDASPAPTQEVLASSLTDLFEQQLQNPNLSEFERDVFQRAVESGEIPQADYDEAFQRYEQCVSDLGYQESWRQLPTGVYQITPPVFDDDADLERYAEEATDCADGTTMRIEMVFVQQQGNPDLLADPRAVAVRCLVEGGFVDASYTADDFEEDLAAGLEDVPFDVADPAANLCLANAGYAVATP